MKILWPLGVIFCCLVAVNASGQTVKQNALGGLEPTQALRYMKHTEELIIIDVATISWFAKNHFINAINIPIENISSNEAEELYREIPSGHPVLVHCRLGMIAPGAYRTLIKLRPDIPEISYISGEPLFDDYNEWYGKQYGNKGVQVQ